MTTKELLEPFIDVSAIKDTDKILIQATNTGNNSGEANTAVRMTAEMLRAYLTRGLVDVTKDGFLIVNGKVTENNINTPKLRRGTAGIEASTDNGKIWRTIALYGDLASMPIVGNALPENYIVGEDGLLYLEKDFNSIVPVSHPDYSTQPSILSQRFGTKTVYEQLVPIKKSSRKDCISALNTLEDLKKSLNYVRTVVDNKFYGKTSFSIIKSYLFNLRVGASNEGEALYDGMLIVYDKKIYCITPHKTLSLSLRGNVSVIPSAPEFRKLMKRYKTSGTTYAIIIPLISHLVGETTFNSVLGDCYLCDFEYLINTYIDVNGKDYFGEIIKDIFQSYIAGSTPDYNLICIADETFFDELPTISGSTILDAKLISQSGGYSPAQVICKKNRWTQEPSFYIKAMSDSKIEYDWLCIQYTEGGIYNNKYCYTSK